MKYEVWRKYDVMKIWWWLFLWLCNVKKKEHDKVQVKEGFWQYSMGTASVTLVVATLLVMIGQRKCHIRCDRLSVGTASVTYVVTALLYVNDVGTESVTYVVVAFLYVMRRRPFCCTRQVTKVKDTIWLWFNTYVYEMVLLFLSSLFANKMNWNAFTMLG